MVVGLVVGVVLALPLTFLALADLVDQLSKDWIAGGHYNATHQHHDVAVTECPYVHSFLTDDSKNCEMSFLDPDDSDDDDDDEECVVW